MGRRKKKRLQRVQAARKTAEAGKAAEAPEPEVPVGSAEPVATGPVGLIGPEWSLRRSARGAALWRHAGAMTVSAGETVEVLALDRDAQGRRFAIRDEQNVPAPGARFRVRRVGAGDRTATFDDLDRARLEGAVLDWIREREPRLVHVLDLEAYGAGLLLALEAAGVPTVVTLERVDELRQASTNPEFDAMYRAGLASVRRVIVRSTGDATVAETAGAPRSRIRVMKPGSGGEGAVLRAYASLYRLLAPVSEAEVVSASA